jgi:hypothetical protein
MWFPVGIAQMDSWVSMNSGEAHDKLNSLDQGSKTSGAGIHCA